MKRGDIYSVAANNVTCVRWMDNRAVTLLSNFLSPLTTVNVKRRVVGSANKIDVNCPSMIQAYNKYMGGVDLMDQKKEYYGRNRKSTSKFYLRLFFDMFDVAINNSCIIYNQMMKDKVTETKELCNTLEFRRWIARKLIGQYTSRERNVPSCYTKNTTHAAPKPNHEMIKLENRRRCVFCAKSKKENRTFNFCSTCQVYLCFTSERNCFSEYHSL